MIKTNRLISLPWLNMGIATALALLTFLVFSPAIGFDYIDLDDYQYVTSNPLVQGGITIEGVCAAFQIRESYWIPLTWLSYMLDTSLWGPTAAGYHFTNILFHACNAALVFLLVLRITGLRWPAAFVAALFAIHPMRVESVAWITERKDVLSAFFGIGALLAYVQYIRRSHLGTWCASLGLFGLSLMAKPMLVMLPFILPLFDFWPVRRGSILLRPSNARRLVLEKLPFLLLATAFAALTYWTQNTSGSVHSADKMPIALRLQIVPFTYTIYLLKTLWPATVPAVYLPYQYIRSEYVLLSVTVLFTLLTVTWRQRRKRPWLLFGFLWFGLLLAPVSGIVRVGLVYMANRFTYLPQIGLLIMTVWLAREWMIRYAVRPAMMMMVSTFIVLTLTGSTLWNLNYWRNTRTLFEHEIELNPDHYIGLNCLGSDLGRQGKYAEAVECFQQSLAINPRYADAYRNLAVTYVHMRTNLDESILYYEQFLSEYPRNAIARSEYGLALCVAGQKQKGRDVLASVAQDSPQLPDIRYNLALAMKESGEMEKALLEFKEQLKIAPYDHRAHYQLAELLYAHGGKQKQAIGALKEALRLSPEDQDYVQTLFLWFITDNRRDEAVNLLKSSLQTAPPTFDSLNNLAWLLAVTPTATYYNSDEALEYAIRARELLGADNAGIMDTLAVCHAAQGDFEQALQLGQRALALAQEENRAQLAEKISRRLKGFEQGKPWIE